MSARTDVAATGIPPAELAERRERLLEHCRANGSRGSSSSTSPTSATSPALASSRPNGRLFAVNVAGDVAVFVPEFEVERVLAESEFERVGLPEYPGEKHPMRILQRVLEDLGMRGAVGASGTVSRHPRLPGPGASEVGVP